mmetsp:Transcript_11362/g.24073  ORF Transcript_11362/g.24073 Transcript_11362/m.24073 type:complete len:204 (-) Transcript_11362:106-717(-)
MYNTRRSMGLGEESPLSLLPILFFFARQSNSSLTFQSPVSRVIPSTTRSVSSSSFKRIGSGPLQGLATLDFSTANSTRPCSSCHKVSVNAFISHSTALGFDLSPSVKEDKSNPLSSQFDDDGKESSVWTEAVSVASRVVTVVDDRKEREGFTSKSEREENEDPDSKNDNTVGVVDKNQTAATTVAMPASNLGNDLESVRGDMV